MWFREYEQRESADAVKGKRYRFPSPVPFESIMMVRITSSMSAGAPAISSIARTTSWPPIGLMSTLSRAASSR